MTTHYVELIVRVKIDVNDPDVIARVVENHDGWQQMFYGMTTEQEVLEHLAYNAVRNGRSDATMLDGWADLPADAVVMDLDDVEPA